MLANNIKCCKINIRYNKIGEKYEKENLYACLNFNFYAYNIQQQSSCNK